MKRVARGASPKDVNVNIGATGYDFPAVKEKRVILEEFPIRNRGLMQAYVFNTRRDAVGRETKAWLADQPPHRFELTFTPKHGSWLNLIEGFFSKLARSVLRHIRVASKQELKDRLMAAINYFNQNPTVHTWTYKLDKAA